MTSHRPDPCKYCAAKYKQLEKHPTNSVDQKDVLRLAWHFVSSSSHEKPALVSYISLALDPIGPACVGENEADVVEPGNKSSRQRLSTGGCTGLGLERSACAEQLWGCAAALAAAASEVREVREGHAAQEPSTCFPSHVESLVCQGFPFVPALSQTLPVTVHGCSLLTLTAGTIPAR